MKKYLISIFFIFSLVFTACSNLIDSGESSEKEELKDGMAKVFISINNSFQRTAFPQDLILENCTDLVLTGATSKESNKVLGKWDTISEINNQAIYLPAGTYTTLTLSARINGYKLQDSKNNVRLYTVDDYDSNKISLNFNLTITSVEYKGESTFEFELIYPAANEYKAVTASVLDMEGNIVDGFNQIDLNETEYDESRKHVFFSNSGIKKLPSGQYLVKFYLYTDTNKHNLANVFQELFHLRNEILTTGIYELTSKADVYSIEYELQEDEVWVDSYEPPYIYQPFKGQSLPSGENIKKTGCQLIGWKEVGQADYTYFTSIQAWSKGNKVICPVWTSGTIVKSETDFEKLLKCYNDEANYGLHEITIFMKNPSVGSISSALKKYPNVKVSLDLSQAVALHEFPSSSFSNVKNLTSIVFPKRIVKIGSFQNCSSLEKIVLPNTVTSVSYFYGCTNLKEVYFDGTLDEWMSISFDNTSNPCLNGANLYLNNELLTDLIIPDGVEIIKEAVFCGCGSITSVTLPASLKKIERNAFYNCNNILKTIFKGNIYQWCTIEFERDFMHHDVIDSNPCYYSKNLFLNDIEVKGRVVIPEGIEQLKSTFCRVEGITEVIIPSTLKVITESAFQSCGIKSIIFPDTVTKIGGYAFKGASIENVSFSENLSEISDYAFSNTNLQGQLNLPDSLKVIGNGAFYECNGLTGELIIPKNVESIGSRAFGGCNFTGTVRIPDSVIQAQDGLFVNTQITDVILGSGLSSYGDYFEDDRKTVNSITFGSNIKSIAANSSFASYKNIYFTGELIDWFDIKINRLYRDFFKETTTLYINNEVVQEIIVPEGVKIINDNLFRNYSKITSVKLSSTVEEIRAQSFAACQNLTSITLNDGLKYIGPEAFSYCQKLEEINIPATVEHIHYKAFNKCSKLTSVMFKDTENWYRNTSNGYSSGSYTRVYEGGSSVDVTNTSTNAKELTEFLGYYYKLVE